DFGGGGGAVVVGDGVGLPSGISPGLALGNSTPPPSAAVGGGSGSGLSLFEPMTRLAMKPNPTTTITPARMTAAEDAISLHPRRTVDSMVVESVARRSPM